MPIKSSPSQTWAPLALHDASDDQAMGLWYGMPGYIEDGPGSTVPRPPINAGPPTKHTIILYWF